MSHPLIAWGAAFVLAGLCFLFSGMETGVFGLSRWRIRQQAREGDNRARVLYNYLEDSEDFLWTVVVGNTLSTFALMSLLVFGLYTSLGTQPFWFLLLFVLGVFFYYAFCDLLPKMLFRSFPNRLCLLMVLPFRFLHLFLSPLVQAIEWASNMILKWSGGQGFRRHLFGTRNELRLLMQENAEGMTTEERAMINRVLDMQSLTVRQVTIPFKSYPSIQSSNTVAELLKVYGDSHKLYIPVWEETTTKRRVVGMVDVKKVIYQPDIDPATPVTQFVQSALYLNEDVRMEEAMRRIQRSGLRMAIVMTLDGREAGVVTLHEILKTIFGEVRL